MNDAFEDKLSDYINGVLPKDFRSQVEVHLKTCEHCSQELNEIKEIKNRLELLPIKNAPIDLLAHLKSQAPKDTFVDKTLSFRQKISNLRPLWRPLGVAFAVVLVAGTWFSWNFRKQEPSIELESLLAAHHQYEYENLVPSADMVQSNPSIQLAMYVSSQN
ncbi:MAG: anti-sigma factor family protein [Elusimicrobiota bacterium]